MSNRDASGPDPLDRSHDTSDFDCGVESLNLYIRRFALRNQQKTRSARTFVITRAMRVVGYFSLSAGSVRKQDVPSDLATGQPDPVPVALLGRLAVDIGDKGRGLGAGLLQHAIRKVILASESIGIAALIVNAIDENAHRFYERHGFRPFPLHSGTLYLPLQEILKAFNEAGDTVS